MAGKGRAALILPALGCAPVSLSVSRGGLRGRRTSGSRQASMNVAQRLPDHYSQARVENAESALAKMAELAPDTLYSLISSLSSLEVKGVIDWCRGDSVRSAIHWRRHDGILQATLGFGIRLCMRYSFKFCHELAWPLCPKRTIARSMQC